MQWLPAAGFSCFLFGAVAAGTFTPSRDDTGITYLFASPSAGMLVALAVAIAAGLTALQAMVLGVTRRLAPARLDEARSGRWAAPLCGLAVTAAGVLPALPGAGERFSPLGYFFYDLRWWWLGALALHAAIRVDRLAGQPVERWIRRVASWTPAARTLLLDALLFTTVIAWAIATTPQLRFISMPHGDEPRYLRYAELWYQGGGLDITQKVPFSAWPIDAPPRFWRIPVNIARAIGEESRTLVADLGAWSRDPDGFRWNRASGARSFATGKNGGVYQLHNPGLAALLFPGYVVDRYLLSTKALYRDELPDHLIMSNVVLLLIFGGCAVALFRLLRRALSSELPAFLWAGAVMLMLPATAFAFQFYPELPALLVVTILLNYVLFHAAHSGVAAAAAAGLFSAGLAWLHPRFLVVALCLAAVAALRLRGGARLVFVTAFGLVILSVAAFEYRATGSWSLTARYEVGRPVEAFRIAAVRDNLIGYLFDRRYGLFANAPILLAAVPGLVLLARRAPAHAALLVALGFALGVPAAGHSLTAASGTPGRLVLAVVPLFIWPVALFVRESWRSPSLRVGLVLLALLSVETGRAYNWTHVKYVGPIADLTASGWRPNLAFPIVRGDAWEGSAANRVLLLAFVGLLAGAATAMAVRPASRAGAPAKGRPAGALAQAAAVATLLVAATVATRANNVWYLDNYLIEVARGDAGPRVLGPEFDRCVLCFRSDGRGNDPS